MQLQKDVPPSIPNKFVSLGSQGLACFLVLTLSLGIFVQTPSVLDRPSITKFLLFSKGFQEPYRPHVYLFAFIGFLVFICLVESVFRRWVEILAAAWTSAHTALALATACAFLWLFILHFGNRQFGGWDYGILIDTGWRQILGQRPYTDFITPNPPGFNLAVKYAFTLFGVNWNAQLYLTALFACSSFLWMYWLLQQTCSHARRRFLYCVRRGNRNNIGPMLLVVQRQYGRHRDTIFFVKHALCQETACQIHPDFILPVAGVFGFDEAEHSRIGGRQLHSSCLHRDEREEKIRIAYALLLSDRNPDNPGEWDFRSRHDSRLSRGRHRTGWIEPFRPRRIELAPMLDDPWQNSRARYSDNDRGLPDASNRASERVACSRFRYDVSADISGGALWRSHRRRI